MKAIVHTRYGPPLQALELRDVDDPTPAAGDVLVDVHAAGVARGDWLITTGQPYIARPMYGIRRPSHEIAGQQVAGRIEATGPDATRFEVGDEVFGWCHGAFAEWVAVDQNQLNRKPSAIGLEQAAAVPISGFAALAAVRDRAEVEPGQSVLVVGASGGVGSMAVQIAKALGAEVTGVCSTGNVDLVRSLGADHVVDYTKEDISGPRTKYDVIIDIAGNNPVSKLRQVLAPEGTLVIVGGTGGPATMGYGRTVGGMIVSPFVSQRIRSLVSTPNLQDLDALTNMIESGGLVPVVDRTYPLAEAPQAVSDMETGSSRGTRVVVVESE